MFFTPLNAHVTWPLPLVAGAISGSRGNTEASLLFPLQLSIALKARAGEATLHKNSGTWKSSVFMLPLAKTLTGTKINLSKTYERQESPNRNKLQNRFHECTTWKGWLSEKHSIPKPILTKFNCKNREEHFDPIILEIIGDSNISVLHCTLIS